MNKTLILTRFGEISSINQDKNNVIKIEQIIINEFLLSLIINSFSI
jgi:hypothetical protein